MYICTYVLNKVTIIFMTIAKIKSKVPFYGYYQAIAKTCNCSSQYVSMVLNNNLGKYSKRNNVLIRQIHETAERINTLFNNNN